MSEVNYEVYPPTEGRYRRQSLEWCRKARRGEKDESEFNLPLVAFSRSEFCLLARVGAFLV